MEVMAGRGRGGVIHKLEDENEDGSDVFGEIGDVFVERTIVDGEKTNLVVFKRHELGEVRRAHLVQVLGGPTAPCAQDKLNRKEVKIRLDRQDHKKRT